MAAFNKPGFMNFPSILLILLVPYFFFFPSKAQCSL
jgi:hypothetical protein